MRNVAAALGGLMLLGPALAGAAECPGNPDAIGTSRTLVVDPSEHPRVGSMQYHESLPLEDHEVVITFDDGPLPPRSTAVLDTLDHECVKATFFLIGKMASHYPDVVRRIRDAGHTIGTHSYSHPLTFHRMSSDRAQFEINQGIAEVKAALGEGGGLSPFFRIPGLNRIDGVERYLASQNLQVWSADEVADDWTRIGPGQVYWRALQRIEANHKGILLLHDIQPRTVEALPYLLRELKRRGFRIVHVVPSTPDRPKTATEPAQWTMHARQNPRNSPIFIETEPELPAPSPASFGFEVLGSNSVSFFQRISLADDEAWQPLAFQMPRRATAVSMLVSASASGWPRGFETADVSNLVDEFPSPAGPLKIGHGNSLRHSIAFRASSDADAIKGPVAVNEIQRLLETLPPEETGPPTEDRSRKPSQPGADQLPGTPAMASAAAPRQRGPAVNAVIPRGAFP
jgi:peptidoglycan-N-acetylglucosamine deacetylase